jgi:hypothetical protein
MPRIRTINDYIDGTLFPFKYALSIRTMVGAGVLIGACLPSRSWGITMACILLAKPTVDALLYKLDIKHDPLTKQVISGRRMAKIEGDFVVFHIGARPNNGIDAFFKWMGDAMDAMTRELEAEQPLGYLGGESYVGLASQGTTMIQYWRSMEHLNKWARNPKNKHASAWAKLMAKGRETNAYGFWHETFEVKANNYECIYVNCPPLLLGNCHESELLKVEGQNQSAAGRAGRKQYTNYAENLGKPDY